MGTMHLLAQYLGWARQVLAEFNQGIIMLTFCDRYMGISLLSRAMVTGSDGRCICFLSSQEKQSRITIRFSRIMGCAWCRATASRRR